LAGCGAATLLPRVAAASQLDGSIARISANSSGKVAVYARALGSDSPLLAYHADDDFPAASTIKLLIMVTAFRTQASLADLFAEKVTLRQSQFVGGSEYLESAIPGDKFTIASLVYAMITLSDNTASNALIDRFGFDQINGTAEALGLDHTHLRRHFLDANAIVHKIQNRTSASDMGRLAYKIESGSHEGLSTVASAAACRKMVGIMCHQEDRDKIPQALPKGTRVANKTGEIDGVRNDVAIVDPYGDRPYVLAVLTKELENYDDGLRAIHTITRAVHQQLHG
jgi:beta-lactamase class A